MLSFKELRERTFCLLTFKLIVVLFQHKLILVVSIGGRNARGVQLIFLEPILDIFNVMDKAINNGKR
eukprot:scaffold1483_cov374-Pavlova_lutheri.AAC.13